MAFISRAFFITYQAGVKIDRATVDSTVEPDSEENWNLGEGSSAQGWILDVVAVVGSRCQLHAEFTFRGV